MSDSRTVTLARATDFDLMLEDHGWLMLSGHLEYVAPDGGMMSQGIGYQVDREFLKGFLRAFRAERLRQVNGRYVWVERESQMHGRILVIRPVFPGEGVPFSVEAWCAAREGEERDSG